MCGLEQFFTDEETTIKKASIGHMRSCVLSSACFSLLTCTHEGGTLVWYLGHTTVDRK
jgi:hypothetical protein